MKTKGQIRIKSAEEIAILRKAGRTLSSIMKELVRSLKSGMTTLEIDQLTEKLINAHDVKAAFKGYRGFPNCACVSVNEEVVHGIPGRRTIKDGDIVSIDVGIVQQGYYADTAVTLGIGKVSPELDKLLEVTKTALAKGIAQAKVQNQLSDISHAIQTYVEANRFSVVREFVGHGIGTELHEEPEILNYGPPHCGPVLQEGMILAVEPMVNVGGWQTKISEDGWTVVTLDGKPSAHFEHTVAVTMNGPEILTA